MIKIKLPFNLQSIFVEVYSSRIFPFQKNNRIRPFRARIHYFSGIDRYLVLLLLIKKLAIPERCIGVVRLYYCM